jgi:hypothetical protein
MTRPWRHPDRSRFSGEGRDLAGGESNSTVLPVEKLNIFSVTFPSKHFSFAKPKNPRQIPTKYL